MSDITLVKEIRQQTGASVKDINDALAQSNGDKQGALEYLEKKGKKIAAKKADRSAGDGLIEAYIHAGGKVGVLLDLACETDFVAKNEDFKALAHDIALHIAALSPEYVSADQIPAEVIEKKKEIIADSEELKKAKDKPAEVLDRIMSGKISAFIAEVTLLDQPFVKDADKTVRQVIEEVTAKLGEKIEVRKFVRYSV